MLYWWHMVDLKKEQNQHPKPEALPTPEIVAMPTPETSPIPEKNEKSSSEKPEQPALHHKPVHHHHSQHMLHKVQDQLTQKVEKILEENVGEAYNRLSPIAKEEFKIKGEATAKKIAVLLKSTHIKVKKIFQLILEWLRLLPGINRFFLEQEAKIKTDRIVNLHNRK